MISIEETAAPPPARRIVLLSIVVFWALYFILWSLRGAVVYRGEHSMLGARALVSTASAGVTLIFYLVMSRVPAMRLGRSMIIAALLAFPAATAYSTINWFVFDHLASQKKMNPKWSNPVQPAQPPAFPTVGTDGEAMPPAPPAPPLPMGVGRMTNDDEDETRRIGKKSS